MNHTDISFDPSAKIINGIIIASKEFESQIQSKKIITIIIDIRLFSIAAL
jgi:hypothetical protein